MNNINLKIEQLENRAYKKSLDNAGQYLKGSELYSKKISDNVYIVFNHYNKGKKEYLQGFDCWISTYKSENPKLIQMMLLSCLLILKKIGCY